VGVKNCRWGKGTLNWEQGTLNWEQGTLNWEQGTLNWEQGRGFRQLYFLLLMSVFFRSPTYIKNINGSTAPLMIFSVKYP
jgi:hypothetical protein